MICIHEMNIAGVNNNPRNQHDHQHCYDHQSVSPSSAGFTTMIISMIVIAIISNLIIRTVLDYTEVGRVDTTLLLTTESLLRQGGLEQIIVIVKVVNIKPISTFFISWLTNLESRLHILILLVDFQNLQQPEILFSLWRFPGQPKPVLWGEQFLQFHHLHRKIIGITSHHYSVASFSQVLFLGKIKASHKRAPPSFIGKVRG